MPKPLCSGVLGVLPDWWTWKDYAVLKAVQTFGSVKDRKALHKILYFANLKTRTFMYQWYTYGPYSPELAYKIADHVHDKSLDVTESDSGGKTVHGMNLSARGRKLLANASFKEMDSALDRAHALLHGMSPRQMDLLASLHFIISSDYEESEAGQILHGLKPAPNFTDAEVEKTLPFLKNSALAELEEAG